MHKDSSCDGVTWRPVQPLMANLAEEPSNSSLHCKGRIDSHIIGAGLLWVKSIALLLEDNLVNVHVSLRCEFAAESEQGHPSVDSLRSVTDAIADVHNIHFEQFIVRNVPEEQLEDLFDSQDYLAFDIVFIEITSLFKWVNHDSGECRIKSG